MFPFPCQSEFLPFCALCVYVSPCQCLAHSHKHALVQTSNAPYEPDSGDDFFSGPMHTCPDHVPREPGATSAPSLSISAPCERTLGALPPLYRSRWLMLPQFQQNRTSPTPTPASRRCGSTLCHSSLQFLILVLQSLLSLSHHFLLLLQTLNTLVHLRLQLETPLCRSACREAESGHNFVTNTTNSPTMGGPDPLQQVSAVVPATFPSRPPSETSATPGPQPKVENRTNSMT